MSKPNPIAEWRKRLGKKVSGSSDITHAISDIRFIREKLRLTQKELADRLGTYQATVGRWEAGTHVPRGGYLRELHKLYQRAYKIWTEEQSGWRKRRPPRNRKG
jgi:DNA-binding transcriptional regulator YiaG